MILSNRSKLGAKMFRYSLVFCTALFLGVMGGCGKVDSAGEQQIDKSTESFDPGAMTGEKPELAPAGTQDAAPKE